VCFFFETIIDRAAIKATNNNNNNIITKLVTTTTAIRVTGVAFEFPEVPTYISRSRCSDCEHDNGCIYVVASPGGRGCVWVHPYAHQTKIKTSLCLTLTYTYQHMTFPIIVIHTSGRAQHRIFANRNEVCRKFCSILQISYRLLFFTKSMFCK
jgi:hypothetical protein